MDKVYLIGEVGPNHNGSVETALTMIEKNGRSRCRLR